MTSDTNLQQIFENNRDFAGVFLYNELPSLNPNQLSGKFLIVNIITAEESLTTVGHFVSIDLTIKTKYTDGSQLPMYFDPIGDYGLPPPHDPDYPRRLLGLPAGNNLKNFLAKIYNQKYTYNQIQLQLAQIGDDICGVMGFVFNREPNFNLNKFFKLYPSLPDPSLLASMNEEMSVYGVKIGLLSNTIKQNDMLNHVMAYKQFTGAQ